jgi:uncharacterized membrane protein YraQ (UPF0718 family)
MSQARCSSIFSRFMVLVRPWIFPLVVVGLYGLGFLFAPESTYRSLRISGSIVRQFVAPLCFALFLMVLLNRFLSPAVVTRFLGRGAGLKGVFLSSLAGVLSMGPIYAWYPLFKTLKEKGASEFIVANFMCNRSVKPVLLPVLVAYFGWNFATAFVLVNLVGALIVAWIVSLSCSAFGGERGEVGDQ